MRRVTEPTDAHDHEGSRRHRLADGAEDELVREEPLVLSVHGQELLTMRTPGRDLDLALGFLLGEGILDARHRVASMRFVPGDPDRNTTDAVSVELQDPPSQEVRGRLSRTHEIRSSCGVCGIADADSILDSFPPLPPGAPRISSERVHALLTALRERQPLFARTGGCHGAILALADGTIVGTGEDVGRHNALDKAIGQAANAGVDFSRCIAVVSGRMGYDLAVKCLRVRIPVLVSVSAPSSLAFQLCESAGATLIGFARDAGFRVYTDQGRLAP
jgi:FdhD protein